MTYCSTKECSYVFISFQDENSCKRNIFCLNMTLTNYFNGIFPGMNIIKIKLEMILIYLLNYF